MEMDGLGLMCADHYIASKMPKGLGLKLNELLRSEPESLSEAVLKKWKSLGCFRLCELAVHGSIDYENSNKIAKNIGQINS